MYDTEMIGSVEGRSSYLKSSNSLSLASPAALVYAVYDSPQYRHIHYLGYDSRPAAVLPFVGQQL